MLIGGTRQHIHHVQVHRDDVWDGADEVLFHPVEDEHSEVGAQAQNDLQKQDAGQRNLPQKEHSGILVWYLMLF